MEKTKLEVVAAATPSDAQDIEALWMDAALGDGITNEHWHSISVGKPRDYFRVHPDPAFRRKTEIYVHKPEGAIDEEYYILSPKMRGRLEEARPCVIVVCVYRDGSPRLWPIMFPRPGEKDNSAWTSARAAARTAIDRWVKLVWAQRSYKTRDAQPGYAPDPDWSKLSSFNEMTKLAVGEHGIMHDVTHAVYRELIGAPAVAPDNADDL